jgi:hypothetical protein
MVDYPRVLFESLRLSAREARPKNYKCTHCNNSGIWQSGSKIVIGAPHETKWRGILNEEDVIKISKVRKRRKKIASIIYIYLF